MRTSSNEIKRITPQIIKMYVDEKMQMWKIAEKTGLAVGTICNVIRKNNVKENNKDYWAKYHHQHEDTKIYSKEHKEFVSKLHKGKK